MDDYIRACPGERIDPCLCTQLRGYYSPQPGGCSFCRLSNRFCGLRHHSSRLHSHGLRDRDSLSLCSCQDECTKSIVTITTTTHSDYQW
jgi:hypothetical protein